MKKRYNLNEELNRMKHLINFNVGDHSHDVLSEQNFTTTKDFDVEVGDVEDLFWTTKSAKLFNESIVREAILINEQDEKDEVDINLDKSEGNNLDDSFMDEILVNVGEGEEESFLAYMVDYFEKLLGKKLNTDFLIDDSDEEGSELNERSRPKRKFKYTKLGKAIRKFFREMFQKSTYKKLKQKIGKGFKKVLGKDGFGGFLKNTFKKLGEKFKGLGKKTKRAFKDLGKKLRRGIKINISTYKPGASEEMSSSQEYSVTTPEDNWDEYINDSKAAKLMVKKMDSDSLGEWEKLKKDEEYKVFAVAAVEYFQKTYKEKKWKEVTVGRDVNTVIEEIPNPDYVPPKEDVFPVEPVAFPVKTKPAQLFADNCTEVGEAVKEEVELLKGRLIDIMDEMEVPEGESKLKINAIYMEASSSRFRNGKSESTGCDASKLTWKQLSEKRLQNLRNYIINELATIGVKVNDVAYTEELNSDGTNGDGSSGPNPGYVHKSDPAFKKSGEGTPYTLSKDGRYKSIDNTQSRDGAHPKKSDYEQYKYVRGQIYIIKNTNKRGGQGSTPEEDNPEVLIIQDETTEYPITFYTPPSGFDLRFKLKLPKISLKTPRWVQLLGKGGGSGTGPSGCEWKD